MGAKKYLKNEFQLSMFNVEDDSVPDYYLSCWQNNRSCVPLLWLRGFLCAGNIAIIVASMVLLNEDLNGFGYWWIYLTHWGLIANALTTMFAFGISLRVYFSGPIDGTFGMPWYFKMYWFLYNASIPMAFLITIFYWSIIYPSEGLPSIDPVLDFFLHGANSVVMVMILATARHSSRLLHFYHTICFAILYLIFSLIYYYAGGLDPSGNVWIYPVLDWSNPGPTSVLSVGVAVGLLLLHILVTLIALGRNYLSRRIQKENRSFSFSG